VTSILQGLGIGKNQKKPSEEFVPWKKFAALGTRGDVIVLKLTLNGKGKNKSGTGTSKLQTPKFTGSKVCGPSLVGATDRSASTGSPGKQCKHSMTSAPGTSGFQLKKVVPNHQGTLYMFAFNHFLLELNLCFCRNSCCSVCTSNLTA